jgi:hypothetical protein
MHKIIVPSLAFLFLFTTSLVFALDPVAPKSERAFGFLTVDSPLPGDILEITSLRKEANAFSLTFRNNELVKVPIGEYSLTVKMQGYNWTQNISVLPTEMTDISVTGYGNLLVKAPNPPKTTVEVYSTDGTLISRFNASEVKTLPVGAYQVTITIEPDVIANAGPFYTSHVTKNDVRIITNETRKLVVWK